MKNKYSLTFPAELAKKPYTYQLVKDYELVINIIRAKISPKEVGQMILEIEGEPEQLRRGIEFLKENGIIAEEIQGEIVIDRDSCIDCGACLAVCPTRALNLDPQTCELTFDREKCMLCEYCVRICPLTALSSSLSE